ncbi:YlxR family protein [Micromonospora sp. CPCC 206061]|nr:YlxR family protein [Phytohabitans aurantiacus]
MVRRARPVRTCVGCRQRAPAAELLRVVAVASEAGHSLMPDSTRRLPGRGAHVHPDPACFALAERRRAFGRALRVTGVLDTGALAEHLRAVTTTTGHQVGRGSQTEQGRTTDMSTR